MQISLSLPDQSNLEPPNPGERWSASVGRINPSPDPPRGNCRSEPCQGPRDHSSHRGGFLFMSRSQTFSDHISQHLPSTNTQSSRRGIRTQITDWTNLSLYVTGGLSD